MKTLYFFPGFPGLLHLVKNGLYSLVNNCYFTFRDTKKANNIFFCTFTDGNDFIGMPAGVLEFEIVYFPVDKRIHIWKSTVDDVVYGDNRPYTRMLHPERNFVT